MPEATDSQPQEPPSGRSRALPMLIVALLMGAEGVGVFFLAKAFGPAPASAIAADGNGDAAADERDRVYAEVELADCRPSNKMSGKFVTFHVRVTALVSSGDLKKAERLVRAKRAQLEDGVNTVIRSADLKHFDEPRYDTIKRRLKHEFDRIFGDEELIKEVLIPQLLQSGSGV